MMSSSSSLPSDEESIGSPSLVGGEGGAFGGVGPASDGAEFTLDAASAASSADAPEHQKTRPAAVSAQHRGSNMVEKSSRVRRQSILETAPSTSRTIELQNGRFVAPTSHLGGSAPHQTTAATPAFVSNQIRSARYTPLTFLPLNLAQQLCRPANFYFVCIAILQVIPAISISGGKPTILLPLIFVLAVSAIKDAIEDAKRSKADREENERLYLRLTPRGATGDTATFEYATCATLQVGDIVKIHDEESFPADLYLLYSSLEQVTTLSLTQPTKMNKRGSSISHRALSPSLASKRVSASIAASASMPSSNPGMFSGSYASVDTANLDGESALKVKLVTDFTRDLCDEPMLIAGANFEMRVEPPNGKLDKFGGMILRHAKRHEAIPIEDVLVVEEEPLEQVISLDHLLLRGSRLRNTGWIYGLVIYTGEESKVRMNSRDRAQATVKRSSIERQMNLFIYGMFGLQVCFCFLGGLLAGIWQSGHRDHTYLMVDASGAEVGVTRFFTWLIIFSGFVPISLLVSLEVVKFAQGVFIGLDIGMCYFVPGSERRAKLAPKPKVVRAADSTALTPNPSAAATTSSSPAAEEQELPGELQFARAQTSGLNESLGTVGFILSDKTGTLTCNSMVFKKSFIGHRQYGTGTTDLMSAVATATQSPTTPRAAKVPGGKQASTINATKFGKLPNSAPHVNWNARDQLLQSLMCVPGSSSSNLSSSSDLASHQREVHFYCLALALCNSVFPTLNPQDRVEYKASSPDEEALVEASRFVGYELLERSPPFVALRLTGPAAMVGGHAAPLDPKETLVRTVQYEQLALLDFTSKRKRMSVIVRSPEDGRVHVFTKGADATILPLLLRGPGVNGDANRLPNWPATSTALTSFSDEGLRTLVICHAVHEASWWDDPAGGWKDRYARRLKAVAVEGPSEEGHAKGACKADCLRCELEEELEVSSGLQLVGGTAVEDRLQDEVPETIKALLQAGIRVWVLTGDRMETAKQVGIACNLLDPGMERQKNLLTIDSDTEAGVAQQVEAAYQHVRKLVGKEFSDGVNRDPIERDDDNGTMLFGGVPRPILSPPPTPLSVSVGLLMESHSYSLITATLAVNPDGTVAPATSSALVRKWLYVASHCKSVVACRCQPSTKSSLVLLIRESQNVTTLAIGDGANDSLMISSASIGVGIRGVEGTAAVQASDYAISQFSHLRRLLFVHGHFSLRRVSILICYCFYKTSLMCFVVFWFGIFSGHSGQNLVMEWAYQLYNVLFVALPVLIFAVFDRDLAPEALEAEPAIYKEAAKNGGARFFSPMIFWTRWMLLALIHSLICFFFPAAMYLHSVSVEPSGQSQGMWELGVLVYTSVVLVANLRLALQVRSWTWLHAVALIGSILAYFAAMLILNLSSVFGTAGGDYNGSVSRLLRTPSFWVTLVITVAAALYFDITLEALDRFRENREQHRRLSSSDDDEKELEAAASSPRAWPDRRPAPRSAPNDAELMGRMARSEEVREGDIEVCGLEMTQVSPPSPVIPVIMPAATSATEMISRIKSTGSKPLTISPQDNDDVLLITPLPLVAPTKLSGALGQPHSISSSGTIPRFQPSSPVAAQQASPNFGSASLVFGHIQPSHSLIQPLVRAPLSPPTMSAAAPSPIQTQPPKWDEPLEALPSVVPLTHADPWGASGPSPPSAPSSVSASPASPPRRATFQIFQGPSSRKASRAHSIDAPQPPPPPPDGYALPPAAMASPLRCPIEGAAPEHDLAF